MRIRINRTGSTPEGQLFSGFRGCSAFRGLSARRAAERRSDRARYIRGNKYFEKLSLSAFADFFDLPVSNPDFRRYRIELIQALKCCHRVGRDEEQDSTVGPNFAFFASFVPRRESCWGVPSPNPAKNGGENLLNDKKVRHAEKKKCGQDQTG